MNKQRASTRFQIWHEFNAEEGEVLVTLEVEATVEVCKDPYGTGDSPTSYEVEVTSCVVEETGAEFDYDFLHEMYQNKIEEQLIEQIRGY